MLHILYLALNAFPVHERSVFGLPLHIGKRPKNIGKRLHIVVQSKIRQQIVRAPMRFKELYKTSFTDKMIKIQEKSVFIRVGRATLNRDG